MTNQEWINACVFETTALLKVYRLGGLSFEDLVRQLVYWTKNCDEARSLVPIDSPISHRLDELAAERSSKGFDIYGINHIGFAIQSRRGSIAKSTLFGITSIGRATVTISDQIAGQKAYVGNFKLGIFADLQRHVIDLADHWSGSYIDSRPYEDIVDLGFYVESGEGEHCVSRWVYGESSALPPKEVIDLHDMFISLANRVVHSMNNPAYQMNPFA